MGADTEGEPLEVLSGGYNSSPPSRVYIISIRLLLEARLSVFCTPLQVYRKSSDSIFASFRTLPTSCNLLVDTGMP